VARLRAKKLAGSSGDGGEDLLEVLGACERLPERREMFELRHAAPRVLMKTCVLDRSGHE
jgi:hypothetical protein